MAQLNGSPPSARHKLPPEGTQFGHSGNARLYREDTEPYCGRSGRRDRPRAVVAIPVHNEVEHIAACLLALDAQTGPAADKIVLLLNNCTDGTVPLVHNLVPRLRVPVETIERELRGPEANAGFARCLAMRCAGEALADHDVLLTTDADGAVAPDWIAANLACLRNGADAACGRAVLHPADAPRIPAHLRHDDALECKLASLLDEIAWTLDPEPHDPWPRHTQHSGASIAVRVGAWRRAGGVPLVASGEDRAFIARLRQIDARVRHAPEAVVSVSGRTEGRARGGMADTIRRRIVHQDEFTDDTIEPTRDRHRRILLRAAARLAWQTGGRGTQALAAALRLPAPLVRAACQAEHFGQAWATLERESPALQPRRVRFADLPAEIELATTLRDRARWAEAIAGNPALQFPTRRKAGGFAPSTPTGVPPASQALRGTLLVPRSACDAVVRSTHSRDGTPVRGPATVLEVKHRFVVVLSSLGRLASRLALRAPAFGGFGLDPIRPRPGLADIKSSLRFRRVPTAFGPGSWHLE